MKIPGLAHEVVVKMDSGVSKIILSLRGDVIASAPVRSRSESGIMKSLIEIAKNAEIAHQIPESIFQDLAKKLTRESGYLDPVISSKDGVEQGQPIFDPEFDEKLTAVQEKIAEISQKLEKLEIIEQKLGKLDDIASIVTKLDAMEQRWEQRWDKFSADD